MNQAPQVPVSNPWQDRDALPSVSGSRLILAAIVCFLCALGLPFCAAYEWVAMTLAAVATLYVVVMARTPSMTVLLLLTAITATSLGGGIVSGSWLLALVVGAAATAFLFTAAKSTAYAVILPLAAAAVALVITKDLAVSMLALSFLPAGILLAAATLMGKGRTTAICFAIGGFLSVIVAWGAFAVWRETGSLTVAGVRSVLEIARGAISDFFIFLREQFLEIATSLGTEDAVVELQQNAKVQLSDDVLRAFADAIFVLLPGFASVICSVLAFEAQTLLNATYKASGLEVVLTNSAKYFTMSLSAAILFALATVLTFFVPSTSLFGALAENLSLILLPGFFIMGAQGLAVSIAQMKGNGRVTFVFVLMILFCACSGLSVFYVLALWGATGRILFAIQYRMLEKMQGKSNGDDEDDPS